MVEPMSYCLTPRTRAKTILVVLALIVLVVTMLPQSVAASEDREVISASEILHMMARGELVAKKNCIIEGDLNLSEIHSNLSTVPINGLDLYVVNNSFSIKNSLITGDVNFNGAYFSRPVHFDGTNITGIANFQNTIFESTTGFEDANFNSDVNFMTTTFSHHTDFENANFTGKAEFSYASFNNLSRSYRADFSEVHFHDVAWFEGTKFFCVVTFDDGIFDSLADFTESEFHKETQFNNVTFSDDAWFGQTTFSGKTEFKECTQFNETASFYDATFTESTDFETALFIEEAIFDGAEFTDVAQFKRVEFNGPASFPEAAFNNVYFDFAKFTGIANFNNTDFNGEARFMDTRFYDNANFNFAKFKDRTYFTDAVFNDSVDFSEADIFQTMKINWSQLDGKLVYNDYFYQSLLRNFETLGQSKDWRDAYYEYHVEKRKHLQSPLDPVWVTLKASLNFVISISGWVLEYSEPRFGLRRLLESIFLDLSCGYGVRPLRTIGCAFIVIGIFAVIYRLIEEKERIKRLGQYSLKDKIKHCWRRFWEFVFLSINIFTTVGKWEDWKPAKKYEFGFRIASIVEGSLGWILMTLFVISLTLTWIR